MVPITCNRSHWRSHFHLQNTFNLTRFSPIVSLSGNLRSSSLCCSTTRSYANKNHIRSLEIHRQRRNHPIPPRSRADDPAHEDGDHDDVSKATLVWRAIKLPIYSVALVPLTVGTAAAYLQTGLCSAKQYVRLLASSVLIITWLNLSNDVYDFDTGADVNKKESVVNMIGSRSGTLIAALVLLGLGSMGLVWASVEAGNIRSILLLVSAVTCGYIYQCPPFRLSYRGLGEPLCFAAFGPFATTAFYLMQGGSTTVERLPITATILSASLLVGITTTLILFCSHFHQIPDDKAVGKFSPLVRIGTETGSNVVKVAVISLYSLVILLGICRALPITSIFLCALTVPMGKLVVSFVADNHQDKTKIFMAKYFCVRLHAIFGVALTAGMVAARIITSNNVPQPIVTI
ncbi:2-carboxy-1,4-naphthoquinone phytyltransferase, chloroplastic isoform X1 [Cynara cardunculus var. scolymus]|uniref:2-carboxy-1,4-naphthoquinone phytyltransferase, chloroplastic isoform X1 n=1 Tax=Cynara cardunculus var. scolymus TaxID=59895 RepID=UPI000D629F75|nr:2-carboxy-1,4-naphthoquinone phytyltransferase, chloroplastic isoform X1 [Cynara cardunculus var. scolymus]